MTRWLIRLLPVLVGAVVVVVLVTATGPNAVHHASGPAGPKARSSVPSGARSSVHRAPRARRGRRVSCFARPGACGFPDPRSHNVGPTRRCGRLRRSGPIVIRRAGRTVRGLNIHGQVTIAAPRVTLENVCVTVDGGASLGSWAVRVVPPSRATVIRDARISAPNIWGRSVDSAAVNISGRWATMVRVSVTRCGECVHDGPWTIRDSYLLSNGMRGTSDHYEDVYCNDTSVKLIHDTLLNPYNQTANVFCDTGSGRGGACSNRVSISRSLLGGGGYMIYACGNSSSPGSSRLLVRDNTFARCRTRPIRFNPDQGGYACGGTLSHEPGAGADAWGYWPRGGYYGLMSDSYCPAASTRRWWDNIWNDSRRRVRCRSA